MDDVVRVRLRLMLRRKYQHRAGIGDHRQREQHAVGQGFEQAGVADWRVEVGVVAG